MDRRTFRGCWVHELSCNTRLQPGGQFILTATCIPYLTFYLHPRLLMFPLPLPPSLSLSIILILKDVSLYGRSDPVSFSEAPTPFASVSLFLSFVPSWPPYSLLSSMQISSPLSLIISRQTQPFYLCSGVIGSAKPHNDKVWLFVSPLLLPRSPLLFFIQ